jgi:hypothetical protein
MVLERGSPEANFYYLLDDWLREEGLLSDFFSHVSFDIEFRRQTSVILAFLALLALLGSLFSLLFSLACPHVLHYRRSQTACGSTLHN